MEKVNNVKEQMGNVRKERNSKKKILKQLTKVKNVFHIGRLDMAKERISGLEDRLTETSQSNTQMEERTFIN